MDWHCIVCKKVIPIDGNDGSNGTTHPNLEGGRVSITFGWPSKFDHLEFWIKNKEVEVQGAICDACFAERKELTRLVEIKRSVKYIPMDVRLVNLPPMDDDVRQSRADLNSDNS